MRLGVGSNKGFVEGADNNKVWVVIGAIIYSGFGFTVVVAALLDTKFLFVPRLIFRKPLPTSSGHASYTWAKAKASPSEVGLGINNSLWLSAGSASIRRHRMISKVFDRLVTRFISFTKEA